MRNLAIFILGFGMPMMVCADYQAGWTNINFYRHVEHCRESILFPAIKDYERKGIEAGQDADTLKNELIAITPVVDKFTTNTCFCVMNEVAKYYTIDEYEKDRESISGFMKNPKCVAHLKNDMAEMKKNSRKNMLDYK